MCDFPYTGNHCNITFEEYLIDKNDTSYTANQTGFILFGSLTFIMWFILLMLKDNTSRNKHKLNLFNSIVYCNIFNSLTFMLRGIDPKSFGNTLPFFVTQLLWDLSTASIYAVIFLLLFFWIRIINALSYNKPSLNWKIIILNITTVSFSFLFSILQSVYINDYEYLVRGTKLLVNVFIIIGLLISVDIVIKDIIPIACHHLYSRFQSWREFMFNDKLKRLKFIICSLHLIGLSTIIYNIIFACKLFTSKESDNVELPVNGIPFSYFAFFQGLSILASLIVLLAPINYNRI